MAMLETHAGARPFKAMALLKEIRALRPQHAGRVGQMDSRGPGQPMTRVGRGRLARWQAIAFEEPGADTWARDGSNDADSVCAPTLLRYELQQRGCGRSAA